MRDVGDYAARGGILDLYAPALPLPVRLDFFGDTLETIRSFDPETQRSIAPLPHLNLTPMSETRLTSETMKRFRASYVQEIGAPLRGDWLFEAVTEGRRAQGIDHWLPLLYPSMDTLFDALKGAPLAFDAHVEDVAKARFAQIADLYAARQTAFEEDAGKANYRALKPERLYLTPGEFSERLKKAELVRLSPAPIPGSDGDTNLFDAGARIGRTFAPERNAEAVNVFDAAVAHVRALRERGARTIVAGWSEGSRERLRHVFADHGLKVQADVGSFAQAMNLPPDTLAFATLAIEQGFEAEGFALLSEQDILGDRLIRQAKRKRRPADLIAEAAALAMGDLVVHIDHGVGRFIGLKTIEAVGAPHDCLEIHYAGGDRLFLPVENLELLSRYGSEHGELDRLGSTGWQTRKARLKKRVREMAGELVRIAAERLRREGARLTPPAGLYDEFCAKFPYDETADQLAAIDATLDDLAAGKPMDRLICGDVGFGKTEVALRAAFVAAINGKQVAVVTPTTLLARQHAKNFSLRFAGLPVKIGHLSRMVGAAEQRETKKGLAEGELDIVIGTHAVLGKTVAFKDLGLVIIDEEQHFGVGHKERLKELRAEVHMLTLSATPIPRTLQLAMSGVRELSIMATPPVDRLAVRSFVSPFDALTVREALLRERYRGGQAFYVCPRIEDLDEAAAFLRTQVPESKFVIAHGQMAPTELETKIGAFYDGQYDILLSTSIVESGLDIPRANTLIVHRADMFGLAQLYQLRGRVGRSKARAYAIFTTPPGKPVTPQAEKRLQRAAIARHARRRLPTRQPRSRFARRRQPARRGAERAHQGGRLRTLSADGAGGGRAPEGGRRGAGAGVVVADDFAGGAGDHPRVVHRRPVAAAVAVPPAGLARGPVRDRGDGRGDPRPLRPAAAGSRHVAAARQDQGAVPARQHREARRGRQGADAGVPRQRLLQARRAGEVGAGARPVRAGAAGPAGGARAATSRRWSGACRARSAR